MSESLDGLSTAANRRDREKEREDGEGGRRRRGRTEKKRKDGEGQGGQGRTGRMGKTRKERKGRQREGGRAAPGQYLMGFVLSAVFRLSMVLLLSSSSSFSKASRDFLYKRKQKLPLYYCILNIVNNFYKISV